jgi:hypothetical protein
MWVRRDYVTIDVSFFLVSFANDSMQDMVYQFLVDQNGE